MKKIAFLILAITCLLTVTAWAVPVIIRSLASTPGTVIADTGNGISAALKAVLGVFRDCEVTINNNVFLEKQEPVLELATSEFTFTNEREISSKWMGSEKVIKLTGQYVAKLGFDLKKYCSITINDHKRTIVVSLGPPELLSLELNQQEFHNKNGWYNSIKTEDLNKIIADDKSFARLLAITPDRLLKTAESGRAQVAKLLSGSGYNVIVDILHYPDHANHDEGNGLSTSSR